MTAVPVAFQSAEGRYKFEGVAQLLNCYAEKRDPDAKAPLSVLPCDGLVEFVNEANSPCRGMIYLPDLDVIYSIHGTSAYRVTYNGTTAAASRIGTVPGIDVVQLSRNQATNPQTVIRSDYAPQMIENNGLINISDADLDETPVTADYVGGYTVYGMEDRRFFISSLNDSDAIAALDFATFEQRAGKLVRVAEHAGELYGFCSDWFEVWRDTGNADFPFEPIGFRATGMLSPDALMVCDNSLMFVGHDGIVYRVNNYNPLRISTHHVERLIQDDASQAGIIGFSWSRGGHAFANLTGSSWSRCFDAATQMWHTRQSYGYDTWRGRFATQAWGKTIVGDALSGKLFYLDSDTYTEDSGTMIWGVDSPTMHAFPNGGIVDAVHFDLATGYGTLSGQGSDPKVMLQVSVDGGNTFGQYRELELGVTGTYATRVTARRLGRFGPKGIVFRLRISDPVVRALVAADVEVRPLKR